MAESHAAHKVFFQQRRECVASMTLIEVLPEGALYYYNSPGNVTVWVVVGTHSVMVAYQNGETDIGRIARQVAGWDRALTDGVAPSNSARPVARFTEREKILRPRRPAASGSVDGAR